MPSSSTLRSAVKLLGEFLLCRWMLLYTFERAKSDSIPCFLVNASQCMSSAHPMLCLPPHTIQSRYFVSHSHIIIVPHLLAFPILLILYLPPIFLLWLKPTRLLRRTPKCRLSRIKLMTWILRPTFNLFANSNGLIPSKPLPHIHHSALALSIPFL
jgi:hypothetical protein